MPRPTLTFRLPRFTTYVAWLTFAAVIAARLVSQVPGAEQPPWQRILTGDEAKRVAVLEEKLAELQRSGRFADAIAQAQEIVTIRERVQDPKHWQSADARRALELARTLAAMAVNVQTEFAVSLKLTERIGTLHGKSRYREADPLLREALVTSQRVLGEDHPHTATIYSNVAANLHGLGKFVEAEPLVRQAIRVFQRVLSNDHPHTATAYNNLGYNLSARGKHAEAEPLFGKAIEIRLRVLGEEHTETAAAYNNAAANLQAQAKFAEAEPLYRKAVKIWQRVHGEEHADTAKGYDNVASILNAQGRYAEAEPLSRKALEILQRVFGDEHPDTAESYNNVGYNLFARGRFAEAEPLYHKALEIRERVLGVDHPDTAQSYNNLAANLNAEGRYAEAESRCRKALEIWTRVYGEEHPDTAFGYGNLALNLHAQSRYAEAEPLGRKALEIFRRVQGEEHPETAASYDAVAANVHSQGRYAEAELLFGSALKIRQRMLGEDHPDTAKSYDSVAENLGAQGKHAEAQPLFGNALKIRHRVFGEDHPETAASYDNVAKNLWAQGKYAEAEPLCRKALEIRHRVLGEDHPEIAASYDSVADSLEVKGKYAEAEPLFRKAQEIRQRSLGEHPETARGYLKMAANLDAQGKYAGANLLYRKALEIFQSVHGEEHRETAATYNNMAKMLEAQGEYAEAELLCHKALEIFRRVLGENHPHTAASYNNVATNLISQGKHADAESLFRNALEIFRRMLGDEHPDTAASYKNLAYNLHAQGKYAEAELMWSKASKGLETFRVHIAFSGIDRAALTDERSALAELATVQARLGRPTQAWQNVEAHLARGLLDDLSARQARPLTAQERDNEQKLVRDLQQLDAKLIALLSASGQGIVEAQRGDNINELETQRNRLVLELNEFEQAMTAKYGVAAGEVYDLKSIQKRLSPDTALLAWVDFRGDEHSADPSGEHWACIVRHIGEPRWVRLPGSGPEATWTTADDRLPRLVRQSLVSRTANTHAERKDLLLRLYTQRLAPLENELQGTGAPPVKNLIVLPAGWMASVPVEALTDAYTLSYAPSATIFAWLREKARESESHRKPRLLALGDPVLERPTTATKPAHVPPDHGVLVTHVLPGSSAARCGIKSRDVLLSYAGRRLSGLPDLQTELRSRSNAVGEDSIPIRVWREGRTLELAVSPGRLGVQLNERPVAEAIQSFRDADALVRGSLGESLPALPGTRREVLAIAKLFGDSQTLLGSEANEQYLDQLAISGRLAEFAFIHFATHCVTDDQVAMRSALVLAQDHLPDVLQRVLAGEEIYDGRYTAAQIMRTWKLDADLVTLSACETALGKESGGEGYLGFSQALLLAGARSLVLSHWRVDDTATALLMTRFYENLLGKREHRANPMPKAEALKEAKQWLRSLTDKQVAELVKTLPGYERGEIVAIKRAETENSNRPFEHPYYWAAFILIGDPE